MLWKKIAFRNYFLVAGILFFLSMAGIVIARNSLPPLVPLYYGKPTGEDQLASTAFLFVVPCVSLLITIINLLINRSINDEFIKRILAVSALIVSLMTTVTITKIILLVGFF